MLPILEDPLARSSEPDLRALVFGPFGLGGSGGSARANGPLDLWVSYELPRYPGVL